MDDIKTKRKSRFEKGSTEAKEFTPTLRSKRGGQKPPVSPPSSSTAITPKPTPKQKTKNNNFSVNLS